MTDDDLGWGGSIFQYVVVYNPAGGFVTGSGLTVAPEGACPGCDTSPEGRARFGFVSKYQQGATAPEGQSQFQFKAGDLKFHSDSYDWLVVAGPKAKFKGVGTIHGTGNCGFMISAVDEKLTPEHGRGPVPDQDLEQGPN